MTDYQSIVILSCPGEENDKKDLLHKLNTIKDSYFVENKNQEEFAIKVKNVYFTRLEDIIEQLDKFISFVEDVGRDDEPEFGICQFQEENIPNEYKDSIIDIDESYTDFENSFCVQGNIGFRLVFCSLRSVITDLPDLGLNLWGEINNRVGDYYEIKI